MWEFLFKFYFDLWGNYKYNMSFFQQIIITPTKSNLKLVKNMLSSESYLSNRKITDVITYKFKYMNIGSKGNLKSVFL